MLWDVKRQKAIHMEMSKQMFGRSMFAGPSVIIGHREDFDRKGPC